MNEVKKNTQESVTHTVKRQNKWIFGTMLFFGILGLIASFALSVERVQQLIDPHVQLVCNVNAILNCGTVMQTWQAGVFGFPNSFIGLMGFSVVITVAVAGLSGVVFPRKFMLAAQVGYWLGLIFAYWLFYQSVFVIQVLCPWCLVVTVSTTLIFETLLRYNFRDHKIIGGWFRKDYDKLVTAAWLVLMAIIVVVKFQDGLF